MQRQRLEKCSLCNIPSVLEPVEKLPNGAVEFIAIHPDKTTHKWVEYPSLESVGRQDHRKIDPRVINCPKCHKRGRVNGYNDYKAGDFRYVIVHEKTGGMWGKSNVAKRRRCYFYKHDEYRNIIVKRLRRNFT